MKATLHAALSLAISSSILCLAHGVLHAHGAVYPPIPDNQGPATGIGDVRGPTSGGRAAGPRGGPGSGAPAAGTPGAGLGAGAAGRSTPGSGTGGAGQDLTSWSWWWEFNKEPFMQLRRRQGEAAASTGGDGFFLGHGRRLAVKSGGRQPSDELVRDEILPALREALRNRESNDMVSGCLIGLARIGNDRPSSERPALAEIIRAFLRDSNRARAEIAAVSLGILGHEPSALLLSALMLDDPAGRRELDGKEVPDRMRAFAAYGLAVLGERTSNEDVRRYIVHRLVRALAADEARTPDLGVACTIALGRVPLAWSGVPPDGFSGAAKLPVARGREGQLRFLLDTVNDTEAHRFVRAHAVTSLSMLLRYPGEGASDAIAGEVASALVETLAGRRKVPREVQQASAIALGLIGDGDEDELDTRIRRVLAERARRANDLGTRHFAILSLGRVAARVGAGPAVDPAPVRALLLEMLGRNRAETRRWAGLSLALLERTRTDAGQTGVPAVAQALHAVTAEARSPSDGAAYSIASGLLRDPRGTEPVLFQLENMNEEIARGHVAVALGLLGAREALGPLGALMEDSTYRPWLLRGCALALGMLGDAGVVDVLLGQLRDTESISAKSSIAQALGRIGDERTVAPLLAMLTDDAGTQGSRAFAAIALGLVADRDLLPWNTVLAVNMNYMAAPPTLYDGQGFGVLNIL